MLLNELGRNICIYTDQRHKDFVYVNFLHCIYVIHICYILISNSGDTPNDQINIELNYSLISDDSLIDDSDDESTYKIGLYKQLYDVRQLCHDKYMSEKLQTNRLDDVIENNGNVNANEKWPPNAALIVGDSMISGVIEKKMRIKNTQVKVRSFPGAKINDFYHYLVPLLKKEPDIVIFHCGTYIQFTNCLH